MGESLGKRERSTSLQYSTSCHAEEKSDFYKNRAALEVRTLQPVRGDLQRRGRFILVGIEGSSIPFFLGGFKNLAEVLIFVGSPHECRKVMSCFSVSNS